MAGFSVVLWEPALLSESCDIRRLGCWVTNDVTPQGMGVSPCFRSGPTHLEWDTFSPTLLEQLCNDSSPPKKKRKKKEKCDAVTWSNLGNSRLHMQTENHCLNENGNVWGNHFHYEQVHSEEVPQTPVTLEGNMVWCKCPISHELRPIPGMALKRSEYWPLMADSTLSNSRNILTASSSGTSAIWQRKESSRFCFDDFT